MDQPARPRRHPAADVLLVQQRTRSPRSAASGRCRPVDACADHDDVVLLADGLSMGCIAGSCRVWSRRVVRSSGRSVAVVDDGNQGADLYGLARGDTRSRRSSRSAVLAVLPRPSPRHLGDRLVLFEPESPTSFSQLVIVPSLMPMPHCGSNTSTRIVIPLCWIGFYVVTLRPTAQASCAPPLRSCSRFGVRAAFPEPD